MNKSQAVAVGAGVDTSAMAFPPIHGVEKAQAPAPEQDYKFAPGKEWVPKPTLRDQFRKPGLWKMGALKAAVFDLSDEKQLAAYNKLLARTLPVDAPGVIMSDHGDTKFFDGKFFVLVHYQEILYRAILNK